MFIKHGDSKSLGIIELERKADIIVPNQDTKQPLVQPQIQPIVTPPKTNK